MSQVLHDVEISITRGAEGKTGRVFVGSMSEEKAVQLASKVASEGFLYSVSIYIVFIPYTLCVHPVILFVVLNIVFVASNRPQCGTIDTVVTVLIIQVAIALLLLEMQRKSKEDSTKKAIANAERAENTRLHKMHQDAEASLQAQHIELRQVLERIEERLNRLETK